MTRLSLFCWLGLVSSATAADAPEARALAARIDHHLEAGWKRAGVTPAAAVADTAFLRRLTLDLTGLIPTTAEVRAFLQDTAPDKRARAVERLLSGPGYVRRFTDYWRVRWLGQADPERLAPQVADFAGWLRLHLRNNTPYDQMVRELLTSEPGAGSPAAESAVEGRPSPRAFRIVHDASPESQAGITARLFLGLNIDCAQCHNHPFARWSREQFWEFAAFFAAPTARDKGTDQLALTIPGTEQTVLPRYLTGTRPQLPQPLTATSSRATLARWMSTTDNPYFARNAVNRLWAAFFAQGLVEPLDDLSGAVPPSHPELLDELTGAFVASGYDLKYLIRAFTLSRAYQLSSALGEGQTDSSAQQVWNRMPVRPLTGEQFYDSLLLATGLPSVAGNTAGAYSPTGGGRQEFLTRFARAEAGDDGQRTILQALLLMNGRLVAEATNPEKSQTLRAVLTAPFLDEGGQIEALYLATLSRSPTVVERELVESHLRQNVPQRGRQRALADVFWMLLNSTEFSVNH